MLYCITIVITCNTCNPIMKTEIISTRIDHNMKIEFTHVCEEIGLSPSQTIKLFAKSANIESNAIFRRIKLAGPLEL